MVTMTTTTDTTEVRPEYGFERHTYHSYENYLDEMVEHADHDYSQGTYTTYYGKRHDQPLVRSIVNCHDCRLTILG